jgi:hypothetical protein
LVLVVWFVARSKVLEFGKQTNKWPDIVRGTLLLGSKSGFFATLSQDGAIISGYRRDGAERFTETAWMFISFMHPGDSSNLMFVLGHSRF